MMSAAALLFASCGDGEKDRNVAPSKVKVEVQTVGDASASGMRYSGTVEEGSGAALSFPVSGTVNRILVSTGSHVRKGQLLATLDASSMRSLHDAAARKFAADVAVIPQYCEDFYAQPIQDAALAERFGGRFNLVFTGTFTPAQSLETVIRAVCRARAMGAADLHFLLVGDGMSRDALTSLVAELNAGDCVTFYGSVPATDIPRFTTLADALIVSLSDSPDLGLTVPAKVASYMAAGKPVIASMDGAGYAAIRAAGCGPACPACDVDTLAKSLLDLYNAPPEERARLGENAKAYYLANYRRSMLLKRLETFILDGKAD